jgi:hypothetical protein
VWALRLEEAERSWSEQLSAAVATASSKVEEFKQRQSLEAAKAAEAAALNAAEAESRCAGIACNVLAWRVAGLFCSCMVDELLFTVGNKLS